MGFFKKALSVFVEVPPGAPPADEPLSDDAQALLDELQAQADLPPPPPPPPVRKAAVAAVPTGADFGAIYAAAGVQPSPYSAEMLLKVADGLRAMPPEQARAAVAAMDAADDRWTAADVLLDADRKIAALGAVRDDMAQRSQAAADRHRAETDAVETQLAATRAEIEAQIEELRGLMVEAEQAAALERAQSLSELEATQNACAAETARLQAEIERLGGVRAFLGEDARSHR